MTHQSSFLDIGLRFPRLRTDPAGHLASIQTTELLLNQQKPDFETIDFTLHRFVCVEMGSKQPEMYPGNTHRDSQE